MLRIYIGKSASGKDFFRKKDEKSGWHPVVPVTTRPIRAGETDGKDYNYLSRTDFIKMIKSKSLLEYRTYTVNYHGNKDTWFYGTPIVPIDKNNVYTVGITAIKDIVKTYGAENVEVIYITASNEIRESRAKKRGSFDKAEWDRRLKSDEEDFSEIHIQEIRDLLGKSFKVINNDKLPGKTP